MPRGSSAKREREYQELKDGFEKEHRYPGREEEVAARIVNKQRSEMGETKEAKSEDRAGKSPDRGLPVADYDRLTIAQLRPKLQELGAGEKRKIRRYEEQHRNRKGVIALLAPR